MTTAEPSPDPTELAELVVTWSGVVLAGFSILMAVLTIAFVAAGFVGMREIRSIRLISRKARKELDLQTDLSRVVLEQGDQAQRLLAEAKGSIDETLGKVDEQAKRVTLMEEMLQSRLNDFDSRLSQQVEVFHLFDQGESAYDEGRYEKAIEFLQRAAELDPQNFRVRYLLSRALINSGDDTRALTELTIAVDLGLPEDTAARGFAQLHRYTDPEKAQVHARQATELNSAAAHHWDFLGLILRDAGDFKGSRRAHLEADRLDRASVFTPFFLGLLEARAQAIPHAKDYSQQAMERLERSERLAPIKYMWAALIRWADCVLRGSYDEADPFVVALRESELSSRRTREVCEHMEFLLRALGREEYRRRYVEPMDRKFPRT